MVEECDVEEREEVDEGSGCVIVAGGCAVGLRREIKWQAGGCAVGLRREIRWQAGPVRGAEEAHNITDEILYGAGSPDSPRLGRRGAERKALSPPHSMPSLPHVPTQFPPPLSPPPPHAPHFPLPNVSTSHQNVPTCAEPMRNGSDRVAPEAAVASAAALPPARGAAGGYELA